MQALSEPVVEMKKESKVFKGFKKREEDQPKIIATLKEFAEEYDVTLENFAYYNARDFGFVEGKEFEKYRKELTKNPDKNGIYLFKKNTVIYKEIKEKLKIIDDVNQSMALSWLLHDAVGFNNPRYHQWLGDRLFVEVKDGEMAIKTGDAVAVNYKEYLQVLMENV